MVLLSLLVLACHSTAQEPEAVAGPQNLVLVVVDTLRADHLQTYGYGRPTSPNLEAFARKGAVFERAYAHAPWTKPSIATLLTSRTPRDHGVTQWEAMLSEDHVTLAEHLGEHGFSTAAYVSHRALLPDETHFQQGFGTYDVSVVHKGRPQDVLSSADITDLGIDFLDDPPDGRWMLMLHYFDPHADYIAHEAWPFGDLRVDRYDSEVAFLDHHLGRLFETLERDGHLDDTVVALVADHGEEFREHGQLQHTIQMWDEVLHVPWIVWAPGLAPQRVGNPVGLVDVAPTLTDLLGLPAAEAFTGRSRLAEDGGLAVDAENTVIAETQRIENRRAVMRGRYKLVVDLRAGETLLFDIETDPGEHIDIAADHPEVVHALSQALDAYHDAAPGLAPAVELDADTREALEALGYLTDSPEPAEVAVDWVEIPGGTFQMGHPREDAHPYSWPVHEVRVAPFEIQRTEMTVRQYRQCIRDGHCVLPPETQSCEPVLDALDAPMQCLSWRDALHACEWLGARLPSEAEWEYAARSAGRDPAFPWGDAAPSCARVSGAVVGCESAVHPVCAKPAGNTAQGVCDMAGNVVEWTEDLWFTSYLDAPADGTARKLPKDRRRVLRGGGVGVEMLLDNRSRLFRDQIFARAGAGVRCVRAPPATDVR